jgi:two-component system, NtrC family, sensor kinase
LKKYLSYLTGKQGLRAAALVVLLLLIAAGFLTLLSQREMKKIIGDDFNAQQLELARHAAGTLSENFKVLKKELITLSLSPSIQYVEPVAWSNRMKLTFSMVRDYGIEKIMLIDASGTKTLLTDYTNTVTAETSQYDKEDFFLWCSNPLNRGLIYISENRKGFVGDWEPGLVTQVAISVYQVSVDKAHPVPSHRFAGVLVFVMNTGQFTQKVVGGIRSGKTGYAWVIDESGNFLYHLVKNFIGQNAFDVRRFKDPHISFSDINKIQKEKMLTGEEGTSWYMSGWHRGMSGNIKKLIAFAPVTIGAANAHRIWSVAVVAPASEVEEAFHSVYIRQILLQGVFTVAIVILLFGIVFMERVWRKSLQRMVDEKTADLEQYAVRLKQSEEQYRSLVESADDLIYTLNQSAHFLSVNRYFTYLTGMEAEPALGMSLFEVIQYENPEEIRRVVEAVILTSQALGREERVQIRDKEYWLDTKYKPIIPGEGMPEAVLVIARDITEHKLLETQMIQTEKLASLGSMSAGVAHEINNPLAVILGFSEMLLDIVPPGSKQYEILKTIERQGNNCKKIVENLLTFARIPEKTETETNLGEDLRRVIGLYKNIFSNEKVDLKLDLEESLPNVKGDSQQLEQVFVNIITNALSAMEGGGILSCKARRIGERVEVDFTDTGHGIPSEKLSKIFDPFFTTKEPGKGTGLGLTVSYAIVKKFGCDIQVKSQTAAEGKNPGTTVTVILPLAGD